MKKAKVFVNKILAGFLEEISFKNSYRFSYLENYDDEPVSLTMPVEQRVFEFDHFPPFFDGVLPEGFELEALLKKSKIDANDYFLQLITVGHDLVGNVTVEAYHE